VNVLDLIFVILWPYPSINSEFCHILEKCGTAPTLP
jgi:hypothetical protein